MASLPEQNPLHVAIIMDGNGRWATGRGLSRLVGHKKGVERVREVVRAAPELGINILTLYAFSSENWNRPAPEVKGLMGLLKSFLERELNDLCANQVRLSVIGDAARLPAEVRKVLDHAIERTRENKGLRLNLALSYGSRDELVRAAGEIAEKCCRGELSPEGIDQDTFAAHLYTAGMNDPDLLIRTGGEHRLSNFLLWQLSYAELYFIPIHWPEFTAVELARALEEFKSRQRRFGRTGEQVEQEGTTPK